MEGNLRRIGREFRLRVEAGGGTREERRRLDAGRGGEGRSEGKRRLAARAAERELGIMEMSGGLGWRPAWKAARGMARAAFIRVFLSEVP